VPDPVVGAVLAKAVGAAGSEAEKTATSLFVRVLGPSADAIGEALGRYTTYRMRNVGKIVERADAKSGGRGDRGIVNPRVAHVLLDEGSYCDDELMADYLGGVLAGSRTPNGRDDRAVAWSRVITGLSALQIRAHYLLYREWAARLHGVPGLNLGADRDCAMMDVELAEFATALAHDGDLDLDAVMHHSIPGLVSASLLGDHYSFGARDATQAEDSPFESVLRVWPTVTGLELYGWAQGLPGLLPYKFISEAIAFDLEDAIPRLVGVALNRLPKPPSAP